MTSRFEVKDEKGPLAAVGSRGACAFTKELVFMGASFNPQTDDPEFVNAPRREFNLWFDPEAAHTVLRAPWKRIVCTPVDVSVKTNLTPELISRVKAGHSAAAQYVATYARLRGSWPNAAGRPGLFAPRGGRDAV